MPLINEFLSHYEREFDYFSELGRVAQRTIEAALLKLGVLAIVTTRAKRVDRLEVRLRQRNTTSPFKNIDEIYTKTKDLTGVRIALYFPADVKQVSSTIEELFEQVRKPLVFPQKPKRAGNRFVGYSATHFVVRLKAQDLDPINRRFCFGQIEIQVASVLMHAWAEVEHDLQYKPETGPLSEDEVAILDELNGLVLAGEIALERLQRAGQRRTTDANAKILNEFELANQLSKLAKKHDLNTNNIGRVDILLELLHELKRDTPIALEQYVTKVESPEKPVADTIVDAILSQPNSKLRKLQEIVSRMLATDPLSRNSTDKGYESSIGNFLNQWRIMEVETKKWAGVPSKVTLIRAIDQLPLSEILKRDFVNLINTRNRIVHGIDQAEPALVQKAADQIRDTLIPAIRQGIEFKNANSSGSANKTPIKLPKTSHGKK